MALPKPGFWSLTSAEAAPGYKDFWPGLIKAIPLMQSGTLARNPTANDGAIPLYSIGSSPARAYLRGDLDEVTDVVTEFGPGVLMTSLVDVNEGILLEPCGFAISADHTDPVNTFALLFKWDGTTGDERALLSQPGSSELRLRIANEASPADLQLLTTLAFSNAIVADTWYLLFGTRSNTNTRMLLRLYNMTSGGYLEGVPNRTTVGNKLSTIQIGSQLANDPAIGVTIGGFWFWNRYFSASDMGLFAADPFGMFRPMSELAFVGSLASLYATGTQTISNVVDENDTTTDLHLSVDDDPDTPNDADWINNAIDISGGDASVFFDVTDLPADFGNAESGTITPRFRGANYGSGTINLYMRFYQSDEATPLSDEVLVATVTADTSFANASPVTITGINTSANKAVWDAARVRFRWADDSGFTLGFSIGFES